MTQKRSIRRRWRQYPDLATYLRESGDSQVNVALKVGASQAQISRLVKGENIPRADLLDRIAKYANVERDSFARVYLARKRGRVAKRLQATG